MTTPSADPSAEQPADSAPAGIAPARAASAAGASGGAELLESAARSERLLSELAVARADVLAPVDLNRTLRLILANQATILRALAAGAAPAAPATRSPLTQVTAAQVQAQPQRDEIPLVLAADASTPTLERVGVSVGLVADVAGEQSAAEAFLGVREAVSGTEARTWVAAFDHRDRDFERGLEKLNRWTSGQGGTPFQVRQDRAYLNLNGSAESTRRYEQNLMERMGFSRRRGRLSISGLQGEVVVYERP